ncbi:MAG: thiamine phosphate synthase [Bacillota bacterium]
MLSLDLYVVTERKLTGGRSLLEVVEESLAGGATVVQLREKDISTREFVKLAFRVKEVARRHGAAFIINDRVDVALAVGADGVHLGQDDMPLELARRMMGEQAVIGVSVSSVQEAKAAADGGADYLGVSAIYSTSTKTDAPVIGLDGLSEIRKAVRLPLVAIGGIHLGNAAGVIKSGADGIAVVSAIMAAADPRRAAETLLEEVKRARASMGRGA